MSEEQKIKDQTARGKTEDGTGTRVEVGQVWRSRDVRDRTAGGRDVTILERGPGTVLVQGPTRKSTLKISTLKARYRLVTDVEAPAEGSEQPETEAEGAGTTGSLEQARRVVAEAKEERDALLAESLRQAPGSSGDGAVEYGIVMPYTDEYLREIECLQRLDWGRDAEVSKQIAEWHRRMGEEGDAWWKRRSGAAADWTDEHPWALAVAGAILGFVVVYVAVWTAMN